MKNNNKFFAQVSEFNKEVIGYSQPLAPEMLPSDVLDLSLIQLREEIDELEQARTVTEQVDALIDLLYFANGALYKIGLSELDYTYCSTAVHLANMTKAAGKKAARGYDGTAQDAVKPANFEGPERKIAARLGDIETINKLDSKNEG